MLQTNGDHTQRVISNDKLISKQLLPNKMPRKKKIAITFVITLSIAAILGTALGLYFHFQPTSVHLQTVVSTTNDGYSTYSSTKFVYLDNNLVGDSVNQTFTLMAVGVKSEKSSAQNNLKRSLQYVDPSGNDSYVDLPDNMPCPCMLETGQVMDYAEADVTLHYTHDSGIKMKFRGNQLLNVSVPIDQVLEYIAQQEDPEEHARLLQDLTQYDGEDETVKGSELFESYRLQVAESLQQLYEGTSVEVYMKNIDFYEMDYDENAGSYRYTNASVNAARRLWSFRHFFHKIGSFFKKAAGDVVHFIKKDGPKILKYGAIAALAGIDIAAKGPSGISDAAKMFKSGNVLTALEMTVEGVATILPPYISMPIQFLGQACFSHPPKMHCTKKAAENAAKQEAIGYVKKHAVSTILSLFQ